MEPHRIVEILKDGESCGSGYLITHSHALTARHVIKPDQRGTPCEVRPLCARESEETATAPVPRPAAVKAAVGWVSSEHDLAIIELSSDAALDIPIDVVDFGAVRRDGLPVECVGSGFPEAAGVDQRTISGTLTWVMTNQRFDLDVVGGIPRDWREWGGFSGTALFAGEQRDLLVGIIRTVSESWNGRVLAATPIEHLLSDTSFQSYLAQAGSPLPKLLDAKSDQRSLALRILNVTDISSHDADVQAAMDLYWNRLPDDEKYGTDQLRRMIENHLAGDYGPRRRAENWKAFFLIAKIGLDVVGMLLAYVYRDERSHFLYIPYLVAWEPPVSGPGEVPKTERYPRNIGGQLVRELVQLQKITGAEDTNLRFLAEVDDPREPDTGSIRISPDERDNRRSRIRLFGDMAKAGNLRLRCIDYPFRQPALEPYLLEPSLSEGREQRLLILYGAATAQSRISKAELRDIITWFYKQLYAANMDVDPSEEETYLRYLDRLHQEAVATLPDGARLLHLDQLYRPGR